MQNADALYTDSVATVNPDSRRRVQNSGPALIKDRLLFAEVLGQLCGRYAFDRPRPRRVQNTTSGYGKLPNRRQRGSVRRGDAPSAVYAVSRYLAVVMVHITVQG